MTITTKSIRNKWVTAQCPNLLVYYMLIVLRDDGDHSDMNLLRAANDRYDADVGFKTVYSMDHGLNAIKWLKRHKAIIDYTKKEPPGLLHRRGRSWKVYQLSAGSAEWIAMFEQFGRFPKERKMNYKKEAQIREWAIQGALKKLGNGDTEGAITTLKYGNVICGYPSTIEPFGDLT